MTRPRAQAEDFAEKLRTVGFEPIFFPVIEIHPIKDNVALSKALEQLSCYEWVVFTSVNAVDVVFDVIATNGKQFPFEAKGLLPVGRSGTSPKIAAIGPKTAQALQARGVTADFVPEEYVAEAILPGLGELRGKWVLLPRAEIARKALAEAITIAGGIAHEIAVYKTLPAKPDLEGLNALKSGVDVVTLTSPSTVQNFVAIVKQCGLDPMHLPNDPVFACIGPITEQAAKEAGLRHLVVAKEYTTEGLIKVISNLEAS
ncbi:MAG TPA: uroporphyrinogen-III synthase [Anaerolineales bacterium]|nr:uroporphyrinogen-III synthase [Anaerolineales bacterium]